jgi:hypothetical protein
MGEPDSDRRSSLSLFGFEQRSGSADSLVALTACVADPCIGLIRKCGDFRALLMNAGSSFHGEKLAFQTEE